MGRGTRAGTGRTYVTVPSSSIQSMACLRRSSLLLSLAHAFCLAARPLSVSPFIAELGIQIAPGASDTEGEQMRAPGEGDVYRQQFHKTGFGEQADLASDLDRKKAEQAPLREEVAERREKDVDVGGAIGGRGGPAVVEGR